MLVFRELGPELDRRHIGIIDSDLTGSVFPVSAAERIDSWRDGLSSHKHSP